MMRHYLVVFILLIVVSCQTSTPKEEQKVEEEKKKNTLGSIQKKNPKLDELINASAEIEILADGFSWAEGPVWVASENMVLFSDVPKNTIHKWTEKDGLTTYLKPSGSTGFAKNASHEGSNGLMLDKEGKLILCQHGDRRLARMTVDVSSPKTEFESLATNYEGKLFNSPNDVAMHSNGSFFFTDPPYGLADSSHTELGYCGVYRVTPSGEVALLDDQLTRPNGIAFSPDEKTLYVANSDPKRAIWKAYDVDEEGNVSNGRVFFDATELVPNLKGLPDGLKVDPKGNIFATGPGGVLVFSPDGEHLGTIQTGDVPTANCAFNDDYSVLYMTSKNYLLSVKLKG